MLDGLSFYAHEAKRQCHAVDGFRTRNPYIRVGGLLLLLTVVKRIRVLYALANEGPEAQRRYLPRSFFSTNLERAGYVEEHKRQPNDASRFVLSTLSSHRPSLKLPISVVFVHFCRLHTQHLPAPYEVPREAENHGSDCADGVEHVGHAHSCYPRRHGKDKDGAEGVSHGRQGGKRITDDF